MTRQAQRNFSLFLNDNFPDVPRATARAHYDVYSLMGCPVVPYGTRYKFVRVVNGQCLTMAIGRAQSYFGPLNLAAIRFRGAIMGVHEIHIVR